MISTIEGLERGMQNVEISRLLALLINEGAVRQSTAIEYFAELAQTTREIEVTPDLRPYADTKALHYDDMANLMRGGDLLPRDPTG